MDLEEAVGFYHSLERFGIRPGLERIGALCERLGSPQNRFRCVHAAGTNGKGSTCTGIASVLTAAGYRTGLYTSPYVIDFRERIRLNGEMIPPEDLIRVTQTVRSAVEALAGEQIYVTEFEAVTAAAFLYYAEQGCDIAVLETGLGGRFDATNIIEEPLCSVITSVSYDHIRILGNTLEEIAAEKCGIIKPGCDVITGSGQAPCVLDVIRQTAMERQAELTVASPDCFQIVAGSIAGTDVLYGNMAIRIPLAGQHQLENAALASAAIEVLRRKGYRITDEALAEGFARTRIPARTEIISRSPPVILDGSHNDGSTAALAETLRAYLPGKRILAVMGMMADKDCGKALANLAPCFSGVIAVAPSNPRSMPADDFCALAQQFGLDATVAASPAAGIDAAYARIGDYDALVVCGSLYLASDVREQLLSYGRIQSQEGARNK